jgi:hypothetical protein
MTMSDDDDLDADSDDDYETVCKPWPPCEAEVCPNFSEETSESDDDDGGRALLPCPLLLPQRQRAEA